MSDRVERVLILLRHGIAEDRAAGKSDEERMLTPDGNRQMQEVARELARRIPGPALILTSPLVRAAETAQWVALAYGDHAVQTLKPLRSGGDSQKVREALGTLEADCIYLVGHEPDLSVLMQELTGNAGRFDLEKAGCYVLTRIGRKARLKWMLSPEALGVES